MMSTSEKESTEQQVNFEHAQLQLSERDKLVTCISQVPNPATRELALAELSKKRELMPDLAPMLWHSFGTVTVLLDEVISVYPFLLPPTLTNYNSNRVCNVLSLMQCLASHPETRALFITTGIPHYLMPFLNTSTATVPFEYLRLTSLGVIGAMVKADDRNVIAFLLETEVTPLCLRVMENGAELSRTVATFILQKILVDSFGLSYICATYDRFTHVVTVLGKVIAFLCLEPSYRLFKHAVLCFLLLTGNDKARSAMRSWIPDSLRSATFYQLMLKGEDTLAEQYLIQLFKNVCEPLPPIFYSLKLCGQVGNQLQ